MSNQIKRAINARFRQIAIALRWGFTEDDRITSYQVISRNNDPSGNPYRAILFYDDLGAVIKCIQARSSMPNTRGIIQRRLNSEGFYLPELPTFHLNPAQYNAMIKQYQEQGVFAREIDIAIADRDIQ